MKTAITLEFGGIPMTNMSGMQIASMVSIYVLVDPTTKEARYVGKTKHDIQHRLKGHLNDAVRRKFENVPRFRWIRKLLSAGISPIALAVEVTSADEWQEAESFWIEYLRCIGFRHSEESKQRMSESAKRAMQANPELNAERGRAVSAALARPESKERLRASLRIAYSRPEVIERCRAAQKLNANRPEFKERTSRVHKGKVVSLETREKLRASRLGKKQSAETIRKSALARTGLKKSEDTKEKMRASYRRRMLAQQQQQQ